MSKILRYKDYNCLVEISSYIDNYRPAIFLRDADDGEVITTATINLPEESLNEGEVFIKNYSENEGILDWLINEGIVENTGREVESGYVKIPVVRILNFKPMIDDEPKWTESGYLARKAIREMFGLENDL